MFDTTPHAITAIFALGMGLAFHAADRGSPTSRAVAYFLASVGLAIALSTLIEAPLIRAGGIAPWGGVFCLPETLAFIFANQWVLLVRGTIPAGRLNTAGPDRLLRLAQLLAVAYALLSLAFPEERHAYFTGVAARAGMQGGLWFWAFAAPIMLSLALTAFVTLLTLRRRPDRAEAQRLVSFVVAAPFMALGMILPAPYSPASVALGLLVFLIGSVQFHVVQGRRAQFMSRFLSPQVAELVSRRGLKSATEEKTLELSVVCCDLRGFTRFTQGTSSQRVIRILREFYDAVGAAAAECGGTIKDQAGDGVLILVGAPIEFDDHAARAVDLARRIRADGMAVTARWSDADLRLGIGVGVASGFVTVGVIGAASRLEYTAVGPAVNLASRLCGEAAHGEVRIDERTAALLDDSVRSRELRPSEPLRLKGFEQPVAGYTLAAA